MSYSIGLPSREIREATKPILIAANKMDTPAARENSAEVVSDVSGDQRAGPAEIASFVEEFGGTGVQAAIEAALFDLLGVVPVFPGSANGSGDPEGECRDCFLLPAGATTADFAHHIHSTTGDGLLHVIDCRSGRQVGADHELDARDVIELVTTA